MGSLNVSAGQLSQILSLLSLEVVDKESMEQISQRLHNFCGNKSEAFKVGLGLTHLLDHPDLFPRNQQRLAILFCLHDLFKSETVNRNPFAAVLSKYLHRTEAGGNVIGRKLFELSPARSFNEKKKRW